MKNKSHIKFCVAYAMYNEEGGGTTDSYSNFEEREDALKFYEELLINPLLYTANFCEVIETTG